MEFAEKSRSLVEADSGSTGNATNISEVLVNVMSRSRASHAFCAFLVLRDDLNRDYSHPFAMCNFTIFLH